MGTCRGLEDPTCEVEEVGVLMELVENIFASVFHVRCCKDGDGSIGQTRREFGTALGVLEGGDAGCD